MMSPWLFNIFMDGCIREMKRKVVNVGAKLRLNGEIWSVTTCPFADDTVLLAESEGDLERVVNELYNVCKRRKTVEERLFVCCLCMNFFCFLPRAVTLPTLFFIIHHLLLRVNFLV